MLSLYFFGFKKMLSFLKKVFIFFAVYFIVISLFFHFLNKDKPKVHNNQIENTRQEIYQSINDPKLKNTNEGKIAIALYKAMLCILIGEACTDNPKDAEKNFNYSLFGFITNLVTLPYTNPPASGIYWAYSGLQNAGFIPKTYAAEGIGFAGIKPFISIWKVFRDISYIILVLILIAIGFMIMFRAKINPQTIISVENSLPKIVVALILITFSFPIAGFLIDLMYISIGIIAVFFSNVQNPPIWFSGQPKEILNKFYFSTSLDIWQNVMGISFENFNILKLSSSIFGIIPESLRNYITIIIATFIPPTTFLPLLAKAIKIDIGNFGTWSWIFNQAKIDLKNLGGQTFIGIGIIFIFLVIEIILGIFIYNILGWLLVSVILVLTLVYLLFRIFFMLLYSYIQIILLIFFSPIILAMEMIPGKSTFSSWIKNLIINLITWPLLIIMILITQILLNQPPAQNNFWLPPFLISVNPEYIRIIISMGILFMTPDLVKSLKEMIGVKPMSLGLNFGAFTAGAGAIVGGAAGAAGQFYTPYQFLLNPQTGILRNFFRKSEETKKTSEEALKTSQSSPGQGPGTNPPISS